MEDFDFKKYSEALREIIFDPKLSNIEAAKKLNDFDDSPFYIPVKLPPLERLRTITEQQRLFAIRNRIDKDIERLTSKKHVGYFITCTLRDNEDTDKLRVFLNKILSSKFSKQATNLLHCYELTESGHLHFHIYIENSKRLQTAQLRKLADNSGLSAKDYNLQNKPIKTNNGISQYINKCASIASYESYCNRTKQHFDPKRVTDLHDFIKSRLSDPVP